MNSSKPLKMSAANKMKQDRSLSEVTTARSKLNGVLQTLVSRSEDPELMDVANIKMEPDVLPLDFSPPGMFSKKSSPAKPPRKRRRKDDTGANEANTFHHTYVMKLFDRSVDLAQFTDNVPLYPVCRAWMTNQPQKIISNRQRSQSPELDMESATSVENSNKLPSPFPKTDNSESMKETQVKKSNTAKIDQEVNMSRDQLLGKHIIRWKAIRQKWKDAAIKNEQRYQESLAIIKMLFER